MPPESGFLLGVPRFLLLLELFTRYRQCLLPLPSNCYHEEQRKVYRVEQPPERGIIDAAREWVSTRSGRIFVVDRASHRRGRQKPLLSRQLCCLVNSSLPPIASLSRHRLYLADWRRKNEYGPPNSSLFAAANAGRRLGVCCPTKDVAGESFIYKHRLLRCFTDGYLSYHFIQESRWLSRDSYWE
nr:hypothetical protein Iba_chr13fCG9410 [Ipomoea batatas]